MSLPTDPRRKNNRLAALCGGGSLLVLTGIVAWAVPAKGSPGPIVYRPAGMDEVTVRRDLVYKSHESGAENLKFDVFLPKATVPAEGWPCVVLIHGGPVSPTTKPKDWKAFDSFGRVLAASEIGAITSGRGPCLRHPTGY